MYKLNEYRLEIPGTCMCLYPGARVKLGRFDSTVWIVSFGWIACDGNRPICAWYLTDAKNLKLQKLLQLTDLEDIYLIEN